MNKFFKLSAIAFVVFSSVACTRITTGEVGIRFNASKEVQGAELMPGSWNQTLVGEVLTFPTKDITILLDGKTPMTSDNSSLADFDITAVYGINPTSVAEIYSTKAKTFHVYDEKEKDTYLMHNYISLLVNNAAYKAVRGYKSLEVSDNRVKIEMQILETVNAQLKAEKLDSSITLSVVQVRNILPSAEILSSATAYVKAQNDLRIKETEVEIAKKESERMTALSSNATAAIAYMNAQAGLNISEGIKNGKVQTIVVPSNMTSLMISK